VFLHHLVKCFTCYYYTVSSSVPYQMTCWHCFSSSTSWRHHILVDTLLIVPQIVYSTRLRSGLFDVVRWTLVLPVLETSVRNTVWESTVLLKDKELFRQLTSGTCVYGFVCGWKEDILSKFCDSINWLNICANLRLCRNSCTVCVIFKRLHFTR